MNIAKIAKRIASERPLETRLQEALDEAETTGKTVVIDTKYGRFSEFSKDVKRIDALPGGKLNFFDKSGKLIGEYSMNNLFNDY